MRLGLLLLAGCGRVGFDPVGISWDREASLDGLVAWYPMDTEGPRDGIVIDESGTGRDGRCTQITTCPAHVGGAYRFDGSHSIELSGAGLDREYTVAAWLRPAALGANGFATAKPNGASAGSWALCYSSNTYAACYVSFDGAGNHVMWATPNSMSDLFWTHVTASYDGTTKRLYTDGILRKSLPITIVGDNSDVVIGVDVAGDYLRAWNGRIADFRIYDRALAGDEVFALATREAPP